jgi:hypothetical protein
LRRKFRFEDIRRWREAASSASKVKKYPFMITCLSPFETLEYSRESTKDRVFADVREIFKSTQITVKRAAKSEGDEILKWAIFTDRGNDSRFGRILIRVEVLRVCLSFKKVIRLVVALIRPKVFNGAVILFYIWFYWRVEL